MNKIQILGVIVLLAGIAIAFLYKNGGLELFSGILIGLGAGLTVYKSRIK